MAALAAAIQRFSQPGSGETAIAVTNYGIFGDSIVVTINPILSAFIPLQNRNQPRQ